MKYGFRAPSRGTPEQVAEDIRDFEAAGLRDLVLSFERPTLEETLAAMERFATRVMPLTK